MTKKPAKEVAKPVEVITSYKGLQCRDFQLEIGQEYTHWQPLPAPPT